MLKLTDDQIARIRETVSSLKDDGFVNVTPKIRPMFERIKPAQGDLFHQIWPRLRVTITADIPASPFDAPHPPALPEPTPAHPDKEV